MLQQLLENLIKLSNSPNKQQSHKIVCKAIANYCLQNNFKAAQFQNEFLKQIVAESKKNNPEYSTVRISASTGIDRRNVKRLLNGENLYRNHGKEDIVMRYLQSYCRKHKTSRIKKRGAFETFQHYCFVAANGTLTQRVIADELLSQGRIIDEGKYYRIPLVSP